MTSRNAPHKLRGPVIASDGVVHFDGSQGSGPAITSVVHFGASAASEPVITLLVHFGGAALA